MIKIIFVCHGNICRSPMAEFVLKDLVKKEGLEDQIFCASAATSTEEIGNPVHPGTRKKLAEVGIDTKGKYAIQLVRRDYEAYDYLIAMDQFNKRNMERITGGDPMHKIKLLLEYANRYDEIADPWYTGDFEQTYQDVREGCLALLEHIKKEL